MSDFTTPAGFVKLPRAVLNDAELSDSAIRTYAILVDASRGGRAKISEARIGERLDRGRTRYAAMAALRQLEDRGHIETVKVGRRHEYKLIGCAATTNLESEEAAIGCPDTPNRLPGDNTIGCPETTLPRRSYLDSLSRNVRGSEKKNGRAATTELGDNLIEVLLDLGWSAQKIRRESAILHRQIGGSMNEQAFISEIQRARATQGIENPVAFAVARFRRQGVTTGAPAA